MSKNKNLSIEEKLLNIVFENVVWVDYYNNKDIVLDGHFTLKELEKIINIIKKNN